MTAPVVPEAMKYVGEDPDKEGRHLWRDENMAKVYRHAGAVKGLSPNDTKGEPETEKGNDYHDGIFSFKYKKGTGNATQEHKKKADKPGSVQGQLIQRLLQQYGQNRCWFDAPAVEIDALERLQYVLLPGTVKARETGEPLATSVEAMSTELAKVDQFIKKFGSRDESGELKPADPRDGVPYAEVITRGRANELREAVDLVARGEYDAPLLSRFQPRDETQIVAVDTQVADDSLCQALMNRERQPADLSPEEVEQLVQELMKRNGKHEQAMTMLEQKMEERCVQVRRDALDTHAVGQENTRLHIALDKKTSWRNLIEENEGLQLKLLAAKSPAREDFIPKAEYDELHLMYLENKARLEFDRDNFGSGIAAAAKEQAKQKIRVINRNWKKDGEEDGPWHRMQRFREQEFRSTNGQEKNTELAVNKFESAKEGLELLNRLEHASALDFERLFEQYMCLRYGGEDWRGLSQNDLGENLSQPGRDHPMDRCGRIYVPIEDTMDIYGLSALGRYYGNWKADPIRLLRYAMDSQPPPDALRQFVGNKYLEFGWTFPPPTLSEIHSGEMNDTTARHVLYVEEYKKLSSEEVLLRVYKNWGGAEELKKRYHMMMKEWHTDKNKDSPWAEEMSRLLNAVKTWLDNLPKKRPRDDPGCSSDEVVMTESVADVADPRSMAPDV